uniref:Uncharacterized protein n=1 Tax=Avena sativa TaxID=4498 RepID=A0ACD5V0H0_AVESA
MNCRFVNLAVRNMTGRGAPFSLYRINSDKLFYPTASMMKTEEGPADPENLEKARLPKATISFDWPSQNVQSGWMNFMSMGSSGNLVVAVDNRGRTMLYDTDVHTIRSNLPMMCTPIWDPISVTVGNNLYVMGAPGSAPHMYSFEALIQDKSVSLKNWYWHCLQPPPFTCPSVEEDPSCYSDSDNEVAEEVKEDPSCYNDLDDEAVQGVEGSLEICSHTVIGDSQIWISRVGAGTYSFDTESGTWNKAADWMLPFRGNAEYVPEYNLWFGFSNNYEQLCAVDLTAVSARREPVLHMAWNDMVWPKSWIPTATYLVPLGFGRFCIAKFFCTLEEKLIKYVSGLNYKHERTSHFGVLQGVEVERSKDGLGMVRHKTKRYSFGCDIAKAL